MPWCDECDKYLAPNTVAKDGNCPTCETRVDTSDKLVASAKTSTKVPWHFWLMVGLLVAYLGWRLVDGIIWAADQIV